MPTRLLHHRIDAVSVFHVQLRKWGLAGGGWLQHGLVLSALGGTVCLLLPLAPANPRSRSVRPRYAPARYTRMCGVATQPGRWLRTGDRCKRERELTSSGDWCSLIWLPSNRKRMLPLVRPFLARYASKTWCNASRKKRKALNCMSVVAEGARGRRPTHFTKLGVEFHLELHFTAILERCGGRPQAASDLQGGQNRCPGTGQALAGGGTGRGHHVSLGRYTAQVFPEEGSRERRVARVECSLLCPFTWRCFHAPGP